MPTGRRGPGRPPKKGRGRGRQTSRSRHSPAAVDPFPSAPSQVPSPAAAPSHNPASVEEVSGTDSSDEVWYHAAARRTNTNAPRGTDEQEYSKIVAATGNGQKPLYITRAMFVSWFDCGEAAYDNFRSHLRHKGWMKHAERGWGPDTLMRSSKAGRSELRRYLTLCFTEEEKDDPVSVKAAAIIKNRSVTERQQLKHSAKKFHMDTRPGVGQKYTSLSRQLMVWVLWDIYTNIKGSAAENDAGVLKWNAVLRLFRLKADDKVVKDLGSDYTAFIDNGPRILDILKQWFDGQSRSTLITQYTKEADPFYPGSVTAKDGEGVSASTPDPSAPPKEGLTSREGTPIEDEIPTEKYPEQVRFIMLLSTQVEHRTVEEKTYLDVPIDTTPLLDPGNSVTAELPKPVSASNLTACAHYHFTKILGRRGLKPGHLHIRSMYGLRANPTPGDISTKFTKYATKGQEHLFWGPGDVRMEILSAARNTLKMDSADTYVLLPEFRPDPPVFLCIFTEDEEAFPPHCGYRTRWDASEESLRALKLAYQREIITLQRRIRQDGMERLVDWGSLTPSLDEQAEQTAASELDKKRQAKMLERALKKQKKGDK